MESGESFPFPRLYRRNSLQNDNVLYSQKKNPREIPYRHYHTVKLIYILPLSARKLSFVMSYHGAMNK